MQNWLQNHWLQQEKSISPVQVAHCDGRKSNDLAADNLSSGSDWILQELINEYIEISYSESQSSDKYNAPVASSEPIPCLCSMTNSRERRLLKVLRCGGPHNGGGTVGLSRHIPRLDQWLLNWFLIIPECRAASGCSISYPNYLDGIKQVSCHADQHRTGFVFVSAPPNNADIKQSNLSVKYLILLLNFGRRGQQCH